MDTKPLRKMEYIEVTQEDIDTAGNGCNNCPIAKSIYRTHGIPVSVSFENILAIDDLMKSVEWIRPTRTFPHIPCTTQIRDFMEAYDDGESVEPTSSVCMEVNYGQT